MRKSILIVDDQSGIRLLLEELFQREKYDTKTAKNGVEAIQQAEKGPLDCVLLDMKMAGMNGIDVLKKMKSSWPNLPVIMMTAYDETELTEEAQKLGAAHFFIKPFDVFEVRDVVNALVNHNYG